MSCITDPSERSPGKFESSGEIGEKLDAIMLNGFSDEELGSVLETGHYALLLNTGLPCAPHAIVETDTQGFVDYNSYETKEGCMKAWKNLEESFSQSYAESGGDGQYDD